MPVKRSYADHGDACATAHAMELVGDHWTYPIIRELMLAPKRFGELESSVHGITPAVLTARLRDLEEHGLVRRLVLPAPARVPAYELTEWGRELRPALEMLGRWAMSSPMPRSAGGGLTPDAAVQSMLTMAPAVALDPPVELALRLFDERVPGDEGYDYCLSWRRELSIVRGVHPHPQASVRCDSSTWANVLYLDTGLEAASIQGDADAVQRLIEAFPSLG